MLPQEVKGIGQDAEIIIAENTPPILSQKISWFKEGTFKERGNNLKALAEGKKGAIKWQSPEVPRLVLEDRARGEIEDLNKLEEF